MDVVEPKHIILGDGEKKRLHKAISTRVYQIEKNQVIRKNLFMDLHRDLKQRFNVASYKDIKRSNLLDAIRYIEIWEPRKIN
jgi:hypothetical protein